MDRLLGEYLESEASERKQGNTIANLRVEINQLVGLLRKVLRDNQKLQIGVEELREDHEELRVHYAELSARFNVIEKGRQVDSIRISRHGQKFRHVEEKLEISGDGLDTGEWSIEELQRAMQAELDARDLAAKTKELAEIKAEEKEEKKWWKRTRIGWVVGAAAWTATSSLPFLGYAIIRLFRGGH